IRNSKSRINIAAFSHGNGESDRNVFLRFGVPCPLYRKEPFPRDANLKVSGPSSPSCETPTRAAAPPVRPAASWLPPASRAQPWRPRGRVLSTTPRLRLPAPGRALSVPRPAVDHSPSGLPGSWRPARRRQRPAAQAGRPHPPSARPANASAPLPLRI
uniref:Uncharacterized protein n=1 Tax=Oryza meridionalis TaxID=40149 RepID=A0A0E0F2M6_9ORYZ